MNKKRFKQFFGFMLVIVLALVNISGCSGSSQTQNNGATQAQSTDTAQTQSTAAAQTGNDSFKRIRFARNEKVLTFDQSMSNNISNNINILSVYDTLVERNPDGTISPRLATKWEVNADATEYIFYLRNDVKFSNGDQFTAEDVKATFMYPVENNTMRSSSFESIERIDVIDEYTVKFLCNKSFGALLSIATIYGVYSHKLVERGADVMAVEMLGTGPYMLKENLPDVKCTLERNPYYWDTPPYYDEYEYIFLLEDSTRLAAIQNGEIDIADNMDPSLYETVESNQNMTLLKRDLADQFWVGLKCDREPFSDLKVREAASLSIDRNALVSIVKGGKPAGGIVVSTALGGGRLPPYEYNPEKAKQLLEESSYDGRELIFLSFVGNLVMTMEQLEAIQAMMTAVGFNVKLDIYDNATFMERRSAELYDMFWTASAHEAGDPINFLNTRVLGNSQMCNYENQEMMSWIRKGSELSAAEDRADAYAKVNEISAQEFAPFLGLNEVVCGYAISNKIDPNCFERAFGIDRVVLPRFLVGLE